MKNEFIDRMKGLPEIYVLLNQWQTPTENNFEIICACKTKEEAITWLNDQYEDDLNWITDRCNCNVEDLDENTISGGESFVQKDVFFSKTYICSTYLH